ncbi:MAG: hypothetical protein HOW73_42285, partial [Polyangiaceae bacterium]|nr:hypothetical protein [Polyangiaceae bacterium]
VPVGDTVVLHFDETCENGTWCSWNDLPDSFEIGAGDLMVRATDDTGWWTDDAGRDYPPYLYRRFTGDFAIVTQVRSLELGGNETLTQDFTVAGFVVRAATGSAPAHDASEATEHWLKFEWGRRGGDFSGLGYLIGQKPSTGGDANNLDGHNTPGATTRLLGLCRTGGDLTFIIDDGGILQFNPETPPEQFTSEIEVGLTSGNWNTNGFVTEAAFPGVAMRSGAITPNCQAVVEDLLAQLGR